MSGYGGSNWGSNPWGGNSGGLGSHFIDVLAQDTISITDIGIPQKFPFRVIYATAPDALSVIVQFSVDIDPSFPPITQASNYTIAGLAVSSAVVSGSNQVTLTTSPAQANHLYVVTVAQALGIGGGSLGTHNFVQFPGYTVTPTFIAGAVSSTKVDLVFSSEMLVNSDLTTTSNYTVVGGPGITSIPVSAVAVSGDIPLRRVTLTLGAPLQSMETYAVTVASAVISKTTGQTVVPNVHMFNWADMSLPTQGKPLSIPISSFSGEISTGLLGVPAGQVFFTPAYDDVYSDSVIEVDEVSVCTRAFDQYDIPDLPNPTPLLAYAPGVTCGTIGANVLWAPAERLGLAKTQISDLRREDVLPKVYVQSTSTLESPIVDAPAVATLIEPIDITKASFLNDTRWKTYPAPSAIVFSTASNLAAIGAGPTVVTKLSKIRDEIRPPPDSFGATDSTLATLI